MKIFKVGRFLKEDYEGAPAWLERFFKVLNQFKDQQEQILDRGISINDNCRGGIFELSLNTEGGVDENLPLSFKFTPGKPRLVICGGCVDVTEEETPVIAPRLAFTYTGDSINIVGIDGLSADRKYRLQVWAQVD